jgi:hypothetical protein
MSRYKTENDRDYKLLSKDGWKTTVTDRKTGNTYSGKGDTKKEARDRAWDNYYDEKKSKHSYNYSYTSSSSSDESSGIPIIIALVLILVGIFVFFYFPFMAIYKSVIEKNPVVSNGQSTYSTIQPPPENNYTTVSPGEKAVDSVINYHDTTNSKIESEAIPIDPYLAIGKKFQGGIIFYLDNTGKHGLISANKDYNHWCTIKEAEDACKTLQIDGYSDWRLPDINELKIMFQQKDIAGNFIEYMYWSSTQNDENHYWGYYFSFKDDGGKVSGSTNNSFFRVRAVRDF